jgi:serine/threonine-protein kinase
VATAPTTERRTALSLGARTFLVTAALIALAMGVSVAVTAVLGQNIARRGIERTLTTAQAAQAAFQELRDQRLRLMARSLASDPFLAAYIAQAAELVETRSILDILYERQRELGCDFIVALDARGRLIVRTDAPDATGHDLAARPLVAEALAGQEAAGVWDEAGTLYEAAIVPLLKGLDLLGYLAVGFRVDDALARQAGSVTGTDVVVVSRRDGATRGVASTLPAGATLAVAAALDRRWPSGIREPAGAELELDGEPWIARVTPFVAGGGEPSSAVVTLASLEAAMATYRQIETVIVVVGLVAMLLAFAVSYPLSRRLLRPVRRLADAADAARRGDYDQVVEPGGDDEVARLARSFRSLLADLREKRDMEAYLTDIAQDVAATATRGAWSPAGAEQPTVSLAGAALAPGSVLGGRYEILEIVGAGGMGIVFKAHDRQVDGVVALKLLKPEVLGDPQHLERMKREIQLARRVTHPNVLRTYDFDVLDGRPVISMEYVHGPTLRRLLSRSGRLPYSAGLHLARQMCAGLAAAHAEGVLHRDLKPENLILQQSGSVRLADFGVAQPLRRSAPGATAFETPAGTPRYMAPEVLRGLEPDARADIYAAGVVLYEIFTGRPPFEGNSAAALVHQQLEGPVASPRERWPEMPEALERVILRCLEKDRERRYPSVAELVAELEALRDEVPGSPVRPAPAGSGVAGALVWLALSLTAPMALAQEPDPAERRWWWTGDLRLRGDFASGLPLGRADFERARSFLRLGVAGAPAPWLELGLVGKGALGSDHNADNAINFDNERSDSVSVDAVYAKSRPVPGLTLGAGKLESPFWLTPLVWDDDLRPIGVSAAYRMDVRAYDELRFAAGWFATDHLHGDDTRFAGAQAAWLWQPGAPWSGEALVGYLAFDRLRELPPELFRTNTTRAGRLANNFQLADVQLALRAPLAATSLEVRADVVRNLRADADDDGVRLIAVAGDAERARSLELAYAYQRIERDAVLAAVNGDDWWFHSRTRGHMLRATFGVTSRVRLRASAFRERRDDLSRDTHRYLIELLARN